MRGPCEADPRFAAGKRGYDDAAFTVDAALEAVDWTLEPFDVMTEATLPGAPDGAWTDVAVYQVPPGKYGVLRFIGQDCNDPTAYQRVSWRVQVNGSNRGGDRNGLIPALEARCGIIDGQLMPFRVFVPPSAFVRLQAIVAVGSEETVVRGRLQGEIRAAGAVGV